MNISKILRFFGFGRVPITVLKSGLQTSLELQNSPMEEDKFWWIISGTTRTKNDREAQCGQLKKQLNDLTAAEIASFELRFEELKRRIYSWDVWGATYVVHGGASDDAFEYFMRWLVSRGRADFERVLNNPDELESIIPKDQTEPCEFEEFGYVASEVWQSKTGIDPWQDELGRFPYTGAPPAEDVLGVPFEDSETALSNRYPKLWSRFGGSPL
jgi:hypothetical protein